MVGLLLTRQLHDAHFGRTVNLAEAELRRGGYNLMLAFGHGDGVAERLEHLRRERVEGILFGPAYGPADVTPLDVPDVSAVAFGARSGGRGTTRRRSTTRPPAGHLLALGDRRIGFPELHGSDSAAGNAGVLADMGVAGGDWWMPYGGTHDPAVVSEAAAAFARRWVAAADGSRPTALLCHDDHPAGVALPALWQAGVWVPRDLSVVGRNNMDSTPYLLPPLTTVDLHVGRLRAAAADLLAHRLANPDNPAASRRIEAEPVVRRSTPDA